MISDVNVDDSSILDKDIVEDWRREGWYVWGMGVGVMVFLVCIVLIAAPLAMINPVVIEMMSPISQSLLVAGAWLPGSKVEIGGIAGHDTKGMATIVLLVLLLMLCLVYGWIAWLNGRVREKRYGWVVLVGIWLSTILAGCVMIFMPAMISRDLFVYADYGHIMDRYGVTLYFHTPWSVARTPLSSLDEWGYAVATYGPVWMYMCRMVAWFAGETPIHYIYLFRGLGLFFHLLNAWLIWKTVRMMSGNERAARLGLILFALSPLALLENVLGAHNDVLVCTFLLLGVYTLARVEKQGTWGRGWFVLPCVALALAVLVKFTALPLIWPVLVLVAYKTAGGMSLSLWQKRWGAILSVWQKRWTAILIVVLQASAIFVVVILLCYLPLWWGHSLEEIRNSFVSPPSSRLAQNSLLRAVDEWIKYHGWPENPVALWLLQVVNERVFWNNLNVLALVGAMLAGMYGLARSTRVSTMISVSLLLLAAFLLLTPWFYPWYVVGIFALALTLTGSRVGRMGAALRAFALTFSLSVLLINLDIYMLPIDRGIIVLYAYLVVDIVPVLIAGLVYWLAGRRDGQGTVGQAAYVVDVKPSMAKSGS